MLKIISTIMLLMIFALTSEAYDKVYYGDGAKTIVVSSNESTLLVFPSPPIAKVCHPDGVIDLFPIENEEELQHMALSGQGADLLSAMNGPEKSKSQTENPIDFMLKLSPFKLKETSKCDIRLANRDTVTVTFVTDSETRRPIIEFESIFKKTQKKIGPSKTHLPLDMFRDYITVGHLNGFINTIESHNKYSTKTPHASYTIEASETDKELYILWKLRVIPYKDSSSIPPLKNVRLNELYFSAWINPKSSQTANKLDEDQAIHLFIMSMNDMTSSEILEKLP